MAEEEKKKPAEGEDKKGAPAEASGKPVLMGMIGAIVVLQVIVAFVVITVTKPKPPKEKAETEQAATPGKGEKAAEPGKEGEKTTASEGAKEGGIEGMSISEKPCEVVINIAGTENKGYLKVAVAFAFKSANKKFAEEMPKALFPVFKHYMIEILSPMTLEELSQPEAKEKFRKELLRKVQEIIPKAEASMEDVFIIDYLIQ